MSNIVHITQNCPTPACSMRVETLLKVAQPIPAPRLCVFCAAARKAA
jgi:hypothetical protein